MTRFTSVIQSRGSFQFFHTAKEYEQWMPIELHQVEKKLSRPKAATASKQETQKLLLELKVKNVVYLDYLARLVYS